MIAGMQLKDKVAVITGGANGIGAGMARRFHTEGARGIVVADIDAAGAERVAKDIGGVAMRVDVAHEEEIQKLVADTIARFGQIDLFCSNAGIYADSDVFSFPMDVFTRMRDLHVLAHVYAARAVLPSMLARGDGYLLHTASAAALATSIESMIYAVTKHATLALAEWLSITYGNRGIKVSALCPQGVHTQLLDQIGTPYLVESAITVEQAAEAVVKGLAEERFLILPHPEAIEFLQRKGSDYDRWLGGMRRFREKVLPQTPNQ